jgi:hypothetical protein
MKATAKFYATHPEARKKRLEYQADYNKRPGHVPLTLSPLCLLLLVPVDTSTVSSVPFSPHGVLLTPQVEGRQHPPVCSTADH